jgi:hypothetical protein
MKTSFFFPWRYPSDPDRVATLIWFVWPLPAVRTRSGLCGLFLQCGQGHRLCESWPPVLWFGGVWMRRFSFKNSAKWEAPGLAIDILFRSIWQDLCKFQLVKDEEKIWASLRTLGTKGFKSSNTFTSTKSQYHRKPIGHLGGYRWSMSIVQRLINEDKQGFSKSYRIFCTVTYNVSL